MSQTMEWRPYELCRENELRAIEHRDPQRWAAIKLALKWGVLSSPLCWLMAGGALAHRLDLDQQGLHALNGDWRP
jgi:hypothetical protein